VAGVGCFDRIHRKGTDGIRHGTEFGHCNKPEMKMKSASSHPTGRIARFIGPSQTGASTELSVAI
jgi:hypothetical protein